MTIPFYNRQGDDMATNKGDLWTFVLSDYNIPCISYHDIKKLAIVPSNTDSWHIESAMSILKTSTPRGIRYDPLTIDMEANRWIRPSSQRFNLTKFESTCPPPEPPGRPEHPEGSGQPEGPGQPEGSGRPERPERPGGPEGPRRRKCPPVRPRM